MIFKTEFKGEEAIKLENEQLRVIILPKLGGKVASLYSKVKDFELVFQNKEDKYKEVKVYSDFGSFDASGFDDAFPSINASMVKVDNLDVKYPNHGEIWSARLSYMIKDGKIELYFNSSILSYYYKKSISLKDDRIKIEYEIINTGESDLPCIWTAHYLVNCDEEMILLFPENTCKVINVTNSSCLGSLNKIHSYPISKDLSGEKYCLNRIYSKSAKKCEKYYIYGGLTKGECGIYYPHKDLTYKLYFDKNIFPYLGFWVTEGGFRGDYNCALEPSNGFYDGINIAEENNKLFVLTAGKTLKFNMEIELT
ncbi:MAG TPA: DUF5107 domain-containing protein [Ruminiclostridium sp.]